MDQNDKTPKQQIVEKILASQNILLTSHVNADSDAVGSILALHHALTKLGKKTQLVVSGPTRPHLEFLPDYKLIQPELLNPQEFVITLNTTATKPPHKVRYQTEENKIHLIVTPGEGNFSEGDVSLQSGKHKFDLIIIADCSEIDRIGDVYNLNQELFHETTTINIDHHDHNENFATINLVDTKSSSSCEIIISILESLAQHQPIMNDKIASCILAGILGDTGGFQNRATTPKSLTVAAQMIAGGADHETIVQNLFRTQTVSELKTWGKILSNLQTKPSLKLAWSKISLAELQSIGATSGDSSSVMDALIRNLSDCDIFMLLVQNEEMIKGSLRSNPNINVQAIAAELGGGGHEQASGFKLYDTTLTDAEELVLNTISRHLSNEKTANTPISESLTPETASSFPEPEKSTDFTPPSPSNQPPVTNQTEPEFTPDFNHPAPPVTNNTEPPII